MEKQKNAVGRRKEAVTRVFLSKGDGKITVNEKDYKVYFPLVYLQNQVELPLKTIEAADKFDIKINAAGGGVKGQAEAAKLGIARALLEVNPELRPVLKAAGLLTRDPRSVERKNQVRKKRGRASSSPNVNPVGYSLWHYACGCQYKIVFKSIKR
jgi:small subunit ribosomal protein S9